MAPVPKPTPQRRRRNAAPSDAILPAEGPKIRPPAWPLADPNPAQRALWSDLWSRPIAVVWHSQRIPPSVIARYVALAVQPPTPALSAQLMALENGLGLTVAAMARLRLRVEPDEVVSDTEPEFIRKYRDAAGDR